MLNPVTAVYDRWRALLSCARAGFERRYRHV
jgi:hypothetical protein